MFKMFFALLTLLIIGCPGPEATWREEYIYDNCNRCENCCVTVDRESERDDEEGEKN